MLYHCASSHSANPTATLYSAPMSQCHALAGLGKDGVGCRVDRSSHMIGKHQEVWSPCPHSTKLWVQQMSECNNMNLRTVQCVCVCVDVGGCETEGERETLKGDASLVISNLSFLTSASSVVIARERKCFCVCLCMCMVMYRCKALLCLKPD